MHNYKHIQGESVGQKSGSRAVNRNCPGQSHSIQCATLVKRISQKGRAICHEVFNAVVPALFSTNSALIGRSASGCRYRASGALGGVSGYGYFWTGAPSSRALARCLRFGSGGVFPLDYCSRAYGFTVRSVRGLIMILYGYAL